MEWLIPEIISILVDIGQKHFKGIVGKIKLNKIKRKLKHELFKQILKRYENEPFYFDLDNFLSTHKVISSIIRNSDSEPMHLYKSRSKIIDYYVQLFSEEYPKHIYYRMEIRTLIKTSFDIIFYTLNDIKANEDVRIFANIAKEIGGELSVEIKEMKELLLKLSQKNFDYNDDINISLKQYFEYLSRIYLEKKNYIPRKLYFRDDQENDIDILEALIKDRYILLLGEAGYGKTYESIDLLSKICTDPKANEMFPIYLPLDEYGKIYSSIIDGAVYKTIPYCEGDPTSIIRQWLKNKQVVLILDGIDDINSVEIRDKFIAEVKNIILHYEKCYLFITSRFNRYNDEFGNIKICNLRGLSRDIVREQLHNEKIYTDIPDNYYELFENPMFLEVGKKVLKENPHQKLFNRSLLFEELMLLLSGEWDRKKGVHFAQCISYSEIMDLLGDFSFNKFNQTSSSLLEFDQYISGKAKAENKPLIINALLRSGVLRLTDKIIFTHKLFKEYLAAYHLINKYPLGENQSIYLDLINCDNWKEVFVFSSGMFKNIDDQDEYLDYIMNNNLKLYVDCIEAKSDLSAQLPSPNDIIFAKRFLKQILRTYTFIINKYFAPIRFEFDPTPGINETDISIKIIRIVGNISEEGTHLNYWFDRVMPCEEDIVYVDFNRMAEYHAQREYQAFIDRKNISSHFISLKNSGLLGDSGRKVAIDLIRNQIKSIIEKKSLIESGYILCERLDNIKHRIDEIKDVTDIQKMHDIVSNMIQKAIDVDPNIEGYTYNGIDIFKLRSLLQIILDKNIKYEDYLLPKSATRLEKFCSPNDFMNSVKANRISKFFYFHQISYLEMVRSNFPQICSKFSVFLDSPYQTVVLIYLKEDEERSEFYMEPAITHYYIASTSGSPELPQFRYVISEDEKLIYRNNIYNEIKQSYKMKGKEAHRVSYSHSKYTITMYSNDGISNTPLADSVYKSIKESIEEVLGNL